MQHQGIQRKQRPGRNDVRIGGRIAIRDPSLALGSHTSELAVVASAPNGVCIEKPIGRCISPGGQVNVNIRFDAAQFTDQVNHRVEVAVEAASREDGLVVAGSIELELIDTILADHLQTSVAKARVIFGAGERESGAYDLETGLLPILQAFLFWLSVATPG